MTRPDIVCAVRAVARFGKNPEPPHKKTVMKMQYLLHTKEWGITYGGQGCGLLHGSIHGLGFRSAAHEFVMIRMEAHMIR